MEITVVVRSTPVPEPVGHVLEFFSRVWLTPSYIGKQNELSDNKYIPLGLVPGMHTQREARVAHGEYGDAPVMGCYEESAQRLVLDRMWP